MKIKDTKSLCPECFKSLDAEVYQEDGKILIKKTCDEHGEFINTYWSDADIYNRSKEFEPTITAIDNPNVETSGNCPNNCGICEDHETSTVLGLIDVTNRCNLRCPICFANAAKAGVLYEPTKDEIRQMLQNLRNIKPHGTSAIQYAGGEPTVRKDIIELIAMAKQEGFTHIQIATNGLRLARKEDFAQQLKDAGLNTVYMAFDGVTPEPYISSRGKNLLPQKIKAIENCRKAGLGIVLVPTLIAGINDQQVGDILKFAFDNRDIIYGVNFQPVSFAGRTPQDQVEKQRVTIPDFINLVDKQTRGDVKPKDFYPPSSVEPVSRFIGAMDDKTAKVTLNCHPHCGIATYVFIEESKDPNQPDKLIPITEFIDIDKFFELLNEYSQRIENGGFGIKKRILAKAAKDLPKLINKDKKPKNLDIIKILINVFTKRSYDALGEFSKDAMLVSCMHFMDPFNFDEDRVKKCVIHYATPDGRIIPFCSMNSIYRENLEQKLAIPLKEHKKEQIY